MNQKLPILLIIFYMININGSSEHYTITTFNLSNNKDICSACDIFDDAITAQNCVVPRKSVIYDFLNREAATPPYQRIYQSLICKNEHDQACGFTIFTHDTEENIRHITLLAVHENHRQRGIASALLKTTEEISLYYSIDTITLEVHSHNKQAIKCYTKNGFQADLVTKFGANIYETIAQTLPCCPSLRYKAAFGMYKKCTKTN